MIVTASEKFFPFEIEELFALWATQAGEGEFSIRLEAHLKSIRERENHSQIEKEWLKALSQRRQRALLRLATVKLGRARNKKRFPKNIFCYTVSRLQSDI